MYQKFTSTEIAAQSRSTMETRDHSKNGVSSKNQRSRINNLRMVCLSLLATSIIFSGCKKPEEPAKPGTATSRYETVPYIKSKNDKSGGLENLVFYDYDGEYNYYFFVLGYVRSVPLAYRSAVYYNGTADFTLKYTMSEVTTESVKSSGSAGAAFSPYPFLLPNRQFASSKTSCELIWSPGIFQFRTRWAYNIIAGKENIWENSFSAGVRFRYGRFSVKMASPLFPDKWNCSLAWRLEK